MKILLVNDYKDKIGGAEEYVWTLKKALETKGHTVDVFSSDVDQDEYNRTQNKKTFIKYLKQFFNLYSLLKFRNKINSFNPDIIHIHNIFNELSPSILLVVKSIPVIMTVHDNRMINAVSRLSERSGKECNSRTCGGCNNCVGWKGALYEQLKRKIHNVLLKKVKLYITPSKYMQDLIEEGGYRPVKTIPNGIRLFKYTKIKNFNRLLFVGRLTKDKGIGYLLNAMPEILNFNPTIMLTIVGDGPDRKYFQNLTEKLRINKNVKFINYINNDLIFKYYSETTLTIIPSTFSESFGMVAMESMSVGRPVIGTIEGALPEIIPQNVGHVIGANDEILLANTIIDLLTNKNKVLDMSTECKEHSLKYSIEKHINNLEIEYKKLKAKTND